MTVEAAVGPVAAVVEAEALGSEWRALAACRGCDPELFHPGDGQSAAPAKAICAGCPVKVECLEYALVARLNVGVYGGTTEKQRKRIRAARRRGAAL